jgi:hypothetical protein
MAGEVQGDTAACSRAVSGPLWSLDLLSYIPEVPCKETSSSVMGHM